MGERIAELEDKASRLERRLTEIAGDLAALNRDTVDEADLRKALGRILKAIDDDTAAPHNDLSMVVLEDLTIDS